MLVMPGIAGNFGSAPLEEQDTCLLACEMIPIGIISGRVGIGSRPCSPLTGLMDDRELGI